MRNVLFKNATLLTMADGPTLFKNCSVRVTDGKVSEIGHELVTRENEGVVDCNSAILMPSLKNAHTHSAMSYLVDFAPGLALREWLEKVWEKEALMTPEDIYWFSQKSFIEYIKGGTTAVFDMYYFGDKYAESSVDFGIRSLVLSTFDEDGKREPLYERMLKRYSSEDSLVHFIFGMHAEYTLREGELFYLKRFINKHMLPFFTHISETEKEVRECLERRGCTPTVFFEKEGLFKFGGGGYHCVHLTEEDIEIFRKNKLNIVSCPGSNLYLNSGIAPLDKYLQLGINIALGTDGPSSNESLSMWREMSIVRSQNPAMDPFEILKMATVNASRAMGLRNVSTISVGQSADLNLVNAKNIEDLVSGIGYDKVLGTYINGEQPKYNEKLIEHEFLERKIAILK